MFVTSRSTEIPNGSFQDRPFFSIMNRHSCQSLLFSLIPSQQKCFLTKKSKVKIDSPASTGNQGMYVKYASFPWPLLVAWNVCKKLARALHDRKIYTQDSVRSIKSYSYVQTVQQTIADQIRLWYESQ